MLAALPFAQLCALIFGLAPTAWDMYTDLELASHLLEEENAHAAGLCYVFICLPGINLVKEQVGIDPLRMYSLG